MKRPRTRPFSVLWKFNAEDMVSSQARSTVRRRRGRPPGEPTRQRMAKTLKLVEQWWKEGCSDEEIAARLQEHLGLEPGAVPPEIVRSYRASELG